MIKIGLYGGGVMTVAEEGTVDVSQVTPECLAYGLSYVTRFGGQAGQYSVAEHSVRMYDWAKAEKQGQGVLRAILLHDAPECLGEGDVQRFVKRQYECPALRAFSDAVTRALWEQFIPRHLNPSVWPWDIVNRVVKQYDVWMGSMEARAFGFPHDPIDEWLDPAFAPRAGETWGPADAMNAFLYRWRECQ